MKRYLSVGVTAVLVGFGASAIAAPRPLPPPVVVAPVASAAASASGAAPVNSAPVAPVPSATATAPMVLVIPPPGGAAPPPATVAPTGPAAPPPPLYLGSSDASHNDHRSANAPRPPAGAHLHDTFYLRMGLGLALLEAHHTAASRTNGVPIFDGGTATANSSGSGAMFTLDIGAAAAPGVIIAGEIASTNFQTPNYHVKSGIPEGGTPTNLSLTRIGMLVDYYPDPRAGLHFSAGAAIIQGSYVAQVTPGFASVFTYDQSLHGFGANLSGGYDAWVANEWSLGGLLRFDYYGTSGDQDSPSAAPSKPTLKAFVPSLSFVAVYN